MDKIDFRQTLKTLYAPSSKEFSLVEVPEMRFLMNEGMGDPNTAPAYAEGLTWLYTVAYTLKFASRKELGKDYVVPPLEGLWWSDDMADFAAGNRDRWQWTQMIMIPDFITSAMISAAIETAARKLTGSPPASLRVERVAEGPSVQIMHIGSYADEAPVIRRLHEEYLPAHGLVEAGKHHEIYLSDPRRIAPEKLKTIIRQPVRRITK
jgi:hypothetical protein